MKIIIAITVAIVAVAGCAPRRGSASDHPDTPYDRALIAHGRKFSAPKDSTSIMWRRAYQWLGGEEEDFRGDTVYQLGRRWLSGPGFSVSRVEVGDSNVFEVTGFYSPGARPDIKRRYEQGANELAYYMHYGIKRENFTEPAK